MVKHAITPLGRVAVLQSLILSKLVYLWIMLPNPLDKFINEVQKMCFEFVWDRKRDKIKRSIAIHNTSNRGINIPDIKTYIKALKLTWLRKLYQNQPNWRRFLQATCPEIDSIKTYRPSMLTARKVNPFWINVFQAYENLSDRVDLNSAIS